MSVTKVKTPPSTKHVEWVGHDFDPYFNDATSAIGIHTQIASLISKASEMDKLFDLNSLKPTWAAFEAPPKYHKQSNRFFSRTLLPWLNIRAVLERFESLEESSLAKLTPKEDQEKEMIYSFLQELDSLCSILAEIHARMLQYKKS